MVHIVNSHARLAVLLMVGACVLAFPLITELFSASQDKAAPTEEAALEQKSDNADVYNDVDEMDRMMNSMMRHHFGRFAPWYSRYYVVNRSPHFIPNSDIQETDKDYIVTVDLPGMEKDNIDITLKDGLLTIKGTREEQKENRGKAEKNAATYYIRERNFGSFQKTIQLPDDIKSEAISASYEQGVLTVILPKKEMSREMKNRRFM